MDPRAALALAKQQASNIDRSAGSDDSHTMDAAINKSSSSFGKDEVVDDFPTRRKRSYLLLSDDPDCYVFDSVVGVIPRETRDLWNEGIRLASLKSVIYSRGTDVVDVVGGAVEADNPSATLNANCVRQKRDLPPVRFSKP